MTTTARIEGPIAPGGICTFSGIAGDQPVHWIGDIERADELERQYGAASPLLKLMLRNAYTLEGLSSMESARAAVLINQGVESSDRCHMCPGGRRYAIADTGLCKGHNLDTLRTRK